MSKYSHLSDSDIRAAIQAMEIGLQEKPQGEEADNIRLSIERAQGELYRRSQKKSDPEPTPKRFPQNGTSQPNQNGRLQSQPNPEPSPRQPQNVNPAEDENESVEYGGGSVPNAGERDGSISSASIVAPTPKKERLVDVKLTGKKETVWLGLAGAKSECRRYFMATFNSATFRKGDKEIETMNLYCNLLSFFQAWVHLRDGKEITISEIMKSHSHFSVENQELAKKLLAKLKEASE